MVYALQITSLFLHWYPACVVWTERWHPDVHSRENTSKTPEALRKWHEASFLEIALLPMVPYLIWAVLYYIKVSTAHPVPLFCLSGLQAVSSYSIKTNCSTMTDALPDLHKLNWTYVRAC